jgi:hypothetical protein
MKHIKTKTAILATELGYTDGNKWWTYYNPKTKSYFGTNTKGGISGKEKTFKQCTQSELQSWLRKKHNIDVYTIPTTYEGVKTYTPVLHSAEGAKYLSTNVNNYEKAIELSLMEALLLIKTIKNGCVNPELAFSKNVLKKLTKLK